MKFTAVPPARPVLTIGLPPFKKGAVKLNDDELKAVALANLDRTIRWNLTDGGGLKACAPGEPDPVEVVRTDGEVVDAVVDAITCDLAYNENLVLGLRALGGLPALPAVILQRLPTVRAKAAVKAA